jgi:hypothetical protein
MQETRGILKTNCRYGLDHLQPMWFRSFRCELSRVMNYCRGVQEIQSEYRCISSETRAIQRSRYAAARWLVFRSWLLCGALASAAVGRARPPLKSSVGVHLACLSQKP